MARVVSLLVAAPTLHVRVRLGPLTPLLLPSVRRPSLALRHVGPVASRRCRDTTSILSRRLALLLVDEGRDLLPRG